MERITYRITLDTHKSGIQRTLQGFETVDKMARRISINLTSSGDTFEIPFDHVYAIMYVTPPNAEEPSANHCIIDNNTIIYDVLQTDMAIEGIVHMQLKLIEGTAEGARRVLISPKFALEVGKSETNDDGAEATATFTSLENALIQAKSVYDSRLLSVEITPDCRFLVHYADGTVYENDYFNDALYNGNAILSESYAKGATGTREGEDTDNAMYYSNVSKSASIGVFEAVEEVGRIRDEARMSSIYTVFGVDFETGNVNYLTANYDFEIDKDTGDLMVNGGENYNPEALIGNMAKVRYNEETKHIQVLENGVWVDALAVTV